MLSSLLLKLSRNKKGLSSWVNDQALAYINYYNDFSYDFDSNGESLVIQKLAQFQFNVVFDVGANVGDWSKMAADAFRNAKVYAFELSESTRVKLKDNLANPRHVVSEFALGSMNGEIEYKNYGDLSTVNTLVDTTYHDAKIPFTREVAQLQTGDTFLATANIDQVDLLKIDVEGAEYQVLEGFKQSLKDHKIRVIQFEYGYANGDAGNLMKDFYELLSAGYEIGKIWSAGVRFAPFDYRMNNFDSGPNYLAVARSDTAIINALRSDT